MSEPKAIDPKLSTTDRVVKGVMAGALTAILDDEEKNHILENMKQSAKRSLGP